MTKIRDNADNTGSNDNASTPGWDRPGGSSDPARQSSPVLVLYKTKEDQVADFLREGIISGRFARGARLKQNEIATMIGTSITPVREAIKLLEAEGFVEGTSHRGTVVAPFELKSTEEIVSLRINLESRLMLEALPRLNGNDMAELKALQREFEAAAKSDDRQAVRATNYRFHELIYSTAQLPLTLRFVRTLWARYPFDLINKLPGRIERASHEHHQMLEALITDDKPALLNALKDHINAGWSEFKTEFAKK